MDTEELKRKVILGQKLTEAETTAYFYKEVLPKLKDIDLSTYDPYKTYENKNLGRKIYGKFEGLLYTEGDTHITTKSGLTFKDFTVSEEENDRNRGRILVDTNRHLNRALYNTYRLSAELEETDRLRELFPEFLDETYDKIKETGMYNFPDGGGYRKARLCEIMITAETSVKQTDYAKNRVYLSYCIFNAEGYYSDITWSERELDNEIFRAQQNEKRINARDREEEKEMEPVQNSRFRLRRKYDITDQLSSEERAQYVDDIIDYTLKRYRFEEMIDYHTDHSRELSKTLVARLQQNEIFSKMKMEKYLMQREDFKAHARPYIADLKKEVLSKDNVTGLSLHCFINIPNVELKPYLNNSREAEYEIPHGRNDFKIWAATVYRENDTGKIKHLIKELDNVLSEEARFIVIKAISVCSTADAIKELEALPTIFSESAPEKTKEVNQKEIEDQKEEEEEEEKEAKKERITLRGLINEFKKRDGGIDIG